MPCRMPERIKRIVEEMNLSEEERRVICNALLVLRAGDLEGAKEILFGELGKEKAKKILKTIIEGKIKREVELRERPKNVVDTRSQISVASVIPSIEKSRPRKGKVVKVPPTLLALSMLEESKRKVMIVTYNPSPKLIKKVKELDKRGIDVTIILNIRDCKALAELGFWYACKPRHVIKSAIYGISAFMLGLTPNYGLPYPEPIIGGLLLGIKGLSPLLLALAPLMPLSYLYAGFGWFAKGAALGTLYPIISPLLKRRINGKAAVTTQKVSIVISDNMGMTTSYPLNDRGLKVSRYVRVSYDGSAEREFFSLWSLSIPLKAS